MEPTKVAWFAGLMDGEGSIGIAIEHKPERKQRPYYLKAAVQMSITEKPAIMEAIRVCEAVGVKAASYSYQERDPAKHRDAWYLRVGRLVDINVLAKAILQYAFLKREQWKLMLEYTDSRLEGANIDSNGRVVRGGIRTYSAREMEIAHRLRVLNMRGPAAIERDKAWQSKLGGVKRG
ncbi:hypothetical protein LCGC14_1826990 [marine sediment metagenome]|uniref:Homing endonuclease LAGLIDADG domain-containing protein n=1 Tax=marine sediment metagenome TaxID=412755 RepID=A0A0F9H5B4_9ZZZZ